MEKLSFDAYNECGVLKDAVERYRARTGHSPSRFWLTRYTAHGKNAISARRTAFTWPDGGRGDRGGRDLLDRLDRGGRDLLHGRLDKGR